MSLRGILLFCLLALGSDLTAQSISVFPTSVNKGQYVTFFVSGTNTNFNGASGNYIYGQGKSYGSFPNVQSQSSMSSTILIPTTAPTGNYTFVADGGFNYYLTNSTPIAVNGPANTGLISGRLRRSTNCSGGQSMANQIVEFLPGPYYAITDAAGFYSLWLPMGSYTVAVKQTPVNHTQLCPASPYSVTLSSFGQVVSNQNFYFQQQSVIDVGVNIIANAHRPGFYTTNYVVLENFGGSTASNITVKLALDPLVTYQSSIPNAVQNADTLTWTVASLPANNQVLLYFEIQTPVNTLGFPVSYHTNATAAGDVNINNDSDQAIITVTGSYDPNDKQVWVRDSVVADGPINPNDSVLRYLVRFQNTGTDTAFNISVRDTLDANLDPGSLQILNSSHNYYYTFTNNNQLEFFFPNILLADSNTNEPLSHGHLEFSLKRLPNLPLGTEIDNTAHIYFDFNAPVVTNTVTSKICPPMIVDFSVASSLLNISIANNSIGSWTSILWDFGDGNTSTGFAPNHTYSSAGTYNVCLTVSDTCGVRNLCRTISATCLGPTTSWQSLPNQLQVNFSDQSSSASAWAWDFGDGNTSTVQNPNHVYAMPGTYQVCLTAMDSCGSDTWCDSVTVSCPAPVAGFTGSTTNLQATFVNQSSGQGTPNYLWDFGDGNTGTSQNPSHTYALPGNYLVCLTTTDLCGSDTWCDSVTVSCPAPTVSFNSSSNLYQATFSNQSTGQGTLSYAWDFGDGNTSTQMSPSHAYTANGSYLVCLTTTDPCGSNTFCDSVVIFCPAPVIAYSVSQSQLTATFTNLSTYQSGSPLFWDFGDGSTDIVSNPTHTYAAPGDYLVCLYIADFCSSDFLCDSVEITCAAPIANFGFNANGTQVQFLDMTTDSIVTWAWDFGDGNTSNMASPTYTYATSGTYTVCLVVTNNCGSMDTTCETLVVVGIEDQVFRSVDLYPNPNDGHFSLSAEFGESGQLKAQIRDLAGRVLYEGDWGEVQGQFKKNMEINLPAGSYFIQLELNGRQINRMFSVR